MASRLNKKLKLRVSETSVQENDSTEISVPPKALDMKKVIDQKVPIQATLPFTNNESEINSI